MLSGIIIVKDKKLPLTWSGEKAKHLADDNIATPHVHPYQHVQAQQFAKVGTLYFSGNKKFISLAVNAEHYVGVALMAYPKFVLICTCININFNDFSKLQQIRKVGKVGTTKKSKGRKVLVTDIDFTPDVDEAITSAGFEVDDFRRAFVQMFNGKKTLPKKK